MEKMTNCLADSCRSIHADAAELSLRFRREEGRITYVTPTSYLELLTMFTTLLIQRKGAVAKLQQRYAVGLPSSDTGKTQTDSNIALAACPVLLES